LSDTSCANAGGKKLKASIATQKYFRSMKHPSIGDAEKLGATRPEIAFPLRLDYNLYPE